MITNISNNILGIFVINSEALQISEIGVQKEEKMR